MAYIYETPTVKAGASREILGGASRELFSLASRLAQLLFSAAPRGGWNTGTVFQNYGEAGQ